jgi:hypothetical protein
VREQLRYRWEGGDVMRISAEFLHELAPGLRLGERFWIGPYCLRAMRWDPSDRVMFACRDRGVVSWLLVVWCRMLPLLDLAYRRAILTLVVWNLATVEHGRVPSWRDIRWPKRGTHG